MPVIVVTNGKLSGSAGILLEIGGPPLSPLALVAFSDIF
jgi:hypothetical protein